MKWRYGDALVTSLSLESNPPLKGNAILVKRNFLRPMSPSKANDKMAELM